MNSDTALAQSVRLLVELSKLDRDSPEAEAIVDKSDEPWKHLTPEDRDIVRHLSAALNAMEAA